VSDDATEILAHKSHVNAVAFSPDGKFLVSAGMDNLVKLWTVEEWSLFSTFFGHEKSANSLSFTPDGELLATSSTDGTVRIWTFPFGSEERTEEKLRSARIAPDGDTVASLDRKDRIRLWSLETGETLARLEHEARVTATAFSPDGDELLAAPAGAEVVRWDTDTGKELGRFAADGTAVAGITYLDDGSRIAASGYEGSVRIFEGDGRSEIHRIELEEFDGSVPLAVSPDGDEIAVGYAHRVRTYGATDGEPRSDREVKPKGVYSLAYDPDGRWLAMGAADKKIRIWER